MSRTFAGATSALLLSLAAAGCGGAEDAKAPFVPPPLLYVTPPTGNVVAGRGALTFTALLRGATGTVIWSMAPAGIGTLSATSGDTVSYLPPASVAIPTAVELTARAAGMSSSATVTVIPSSPPANASLTVSPGTACLVAGDGPTTFEAHLEGAYGAVTWSLEPAGVGTLSASGLVAAYLPPAALAAPAMVKVVATGAGLAASATVGVATQAPGNLPVVAALSPEWTVAGGPSFALTVDGSGFVPGTVVRWNGLNRPTTFVGCTRVVAGVPQADVARTGAAAISVVNPGEAVSNVRAFAIGGRLVARVSVASNGTVPEPGSASLRPVASGDGRLVAFVSTARNLVPGDGDQNQEVFLRDTCFGAPPGCVPRTERVSMLAEYALHYYDEPAITPDGRFVAFVHMGPRVSGGSVDITGSGIYLRDTCRGAPPGCSPSTQQVSLPADGWTPIPSMGGGRRTGSPAISSDGRFVAFYSELSLVPEDSPTSAGDVYVRDTCRGAPPGCAPTTTLVSVDPSGDPGVFIRDWTQVGTVGISANGRYVSFLASSGWLVPDDTGGFPDMFVRDTCNGGPTGCLPKTRRVSVGDQGQQGSGATTEGSLSSSGRFAAFVSGASNLVPGDVNEEFDVFLRDTCLGAPPGCTPTTELVSVASDGTQGNGNSFHPQVSADGRLVVFASWATNLVPYDTNGTVDVFLRDTCRGAPAGCAPSTIRLSIAGDGSQASPAYWAWRGPSISADGRAVVLASLSYDGPGDAGKNDVSLVATCAEPSSPGCGPSGALRVTTATTGVEVDPDGYLIRLHRLGTTSWDTAAVSSQGYSIIFALPPDTYEVTLAGLAANCDALAPAKATVAITPGGTAEASFAVTCRPVTALAFEYGSAGRADTTLYQVNSNGTSAFEIAFAGSWSEWNPAWSPDGVGLAFTSAWHGGICWGTPTFIDDPTQPYFQMSAGCLDDPAASQPSWKPDGTRIAFVSERDGNPEIYTVSPDWTNPVRLTNDPASDLHPAWSRDGTLIAFVRSDATGSRVYVMNADGSGAAPLTSGPAEETTPAWSPDGTKIAYSRRECRDGPTGRECDPWDVYVRHPDGTSEPVALGSALADALDPAWSPDGRKIAYSYRLRDSATADRDHLSALAIVRVDGTRPDLADPLRTEFISGLGERPAWRR